MTTEQLDEVTGAMRSIAAAIRPLDAVPGHDATGGTIDSLTEAMMGATAALCRIADALENVAVAIKEHGEG